MRSHVPTFQRLVPGLALLLAGWLPPARAADRVDPPKEYQAAVRALEEYISEQVEAKRLPALSIALVDDQRIVWARGFGFADPRTKKPPRPKPCTASARCRSCSLTSQSCASSSEASSTLTLL